MQNKKAKTSPMLMFGIVAVVILLAVAVFGIYRMSVSKPTDVTDIGDCADSTGILTVQDRSILTGGTAPTTPTITCGVKGADGEYLLGTTVTSGTTTFAVGSYLRCLISDTDSIDKSFDFVMPCGGKILDGALYYSTSDNPGIRMKNDDGDFMTDSHVGATNQTDITSGETFNLDVEFQGTDKEASGKGIWIIEFPAVSSANITTVTLDGKQPISVPSVHPSVNANSKLVAFEIPNMEGGVKKTMTLSVVTSLDVVGGVYTDWYSIQEFIDDDLTLGEGVQDSDGTLAYENTLDYDFYIN